MACSARGVNGQGRALPPSVAAVETGPNGRAPFSSSTQALVGLLADWDSARGVNGQGRVLHISVAAVETGPNGWAPFSSSTRALAGLVVGWGLARGVNGQGRVSTPPLLLSKLGRMVGPPSFPLLRPWRAWPRARPLSPRMRRRASRRSNLAQGDPTSCRPQQRWENELGRSGRYR